MQTTTKKKKKAQISIKMTIFLYLYSFFVVFCVCQSDLLVCDDYSLKNNFETSDLVFQGKLVEENSPEFTFDVTKVYKYNPEDPRTFPAVLEGKRATVYLSSHLSPCGKAWRFRQPSKGVGHYYIMFLVGSPTAFLFSPRGKSGEYMSSAGEWSHRYDRCHLDELERKQFDICKGCTDQDGNLVGEGVVAKGDGCNTCQCQPDFTQAQCTEYDCGSGEAQMYIFAAVASVLFLACVIAIAAERRRRKYGKTYERDAELTDTGGDDKEEEAK